MVSNPVDDGRCSKCHKLYKRRNVVGKFIRRAKWVVDAERVGPKEIVKDKNGLVKSTRLLFSVCGDCFKLVRSG